MAKQRFKPEEIGQGKGMDMITAGRNAGGSITIRSGRTVR